MNGLGIINIGKGSWDEVEALLNMMESDGWEVLGLKVIPGEGVYLLVFERILEWLKK